MSDPLPHRLRRLRRAHGWSLRTLAERSGVSAGMLSEVERGTKSPTVRLAYQVARALGCSISELLGGPPTAGASTSPGILPGPASVLVDEETGARRESYGHPLLHGRLELVLYTLPPGASSGEMAPNRPGTLETVLALDGPVEVLLDGRPHLLGPGALLGHGVHATQYRNPSAERSCRFQVLVDTSRC